jgi:hypothetical protein
MPATNLETVTAYVPPGIAQRIRDEAERQQRSQSFVVADILKAWVEAADTRSNP